MERNYKLIIIVLVVLMILVVIFGGILFFVTDLFKSNDRLFKKYLAQDLDNLINVFDFSNEEKYIDYIKSNSYTEDTDIKLSFLENENDQEEIYDIKVEGIANKAENSIHKNIKAMYGSEELSNIDLLRLDEIYGIRFSDLVQQFVSIENSTMYYVISNLGYNGKHFQEKINLDNFDFKGLLDFSDEEFEKMKLDYYNAIFSDISSKSYSSKNKVMITLNNGDSITTKQFTLTLSRTELDKIYKKILNQAMNDQVLLSKLERIDKEITDAGYIEFEGESLKDRYLSKLKEKYDSIEYLGKNDEKIIFSVYQSKGITYRVSMKTDLNEYIIDLNKKEGKELSLKKVQLTQEGEDITIVSLRNSLNDSKKFTYKDNNQSLEIDIGEKNLDNSINIIGNILYKNKNINKLNIDLSSTLDFSSNKPIEIKFSNNNNILLNNYETEDIDKIFSSLKSRIIKRVEEKQSIIKTKMLNNISLWIDKKETARINEEKNNQELNKQRFNNKFILYEGENIDEDTLKKLLVVAGKNMTDFQVISGKQIKLLIKSGNKSEEKAEMISNVLTKNRKTYNIKMEYSEDGYINAIDISIYEK